MSDFFTWEILATFAGATTATAIITQFIKEGLKKIPTQIVSYVIALVILALATAVQSGTGAGWSVWALIPFNAVIVSLSANGAYAAVDRIKNG